MGKLASLDVQISLEKNKKMNFVWYQKKTNTGIIVKFRSCASFQYKKV